MKKILVCLVALSCATVSAAFLSLESRVSDNKSVSHFWPNGSPTARFASLELANLVPASGTASVSVVHFWPDGTARTNKLASVSCSTNAVHSFSTGNYVFPGDAVRVDFSAATNGCSIVVLED